MSLPHPTVQISNLKRYAVIVAGGSGSRMQAIVPKQFLLLTGRPILMYTIEAFYQGDIKPEIIVVMHPNFQEYWTELCSTYSFMVPHQLVSGGETRFHSVKNAVDLIDDDALIAVQDAVRPLTNTAVIEQAYQTAAVYGNAVVAVKSRDSIRRLRDGQSESMIRDEIYLVQTPQTFKASLLKAAYRQPYQTHYTDDASVAEHHGEQIKLIEGDHRNIKITFPEDIAIAELLLKQKTT